MGPRPVIDEIPAQLLAARIGDPGAGMQPDIAGQDGEGDDGEDPGDTADARAVQPVSLGKKGNQSCHEAGAGVPALSSGLRPSKG
jgi:hypothetical protein